MIAMKSKKLEAARPPNGCDYTKLPTLFQSFPETNSFHNSCSLNYGTKNGGREFKIYTSDKILLWQLCWCFGQRFTPKSIRMVQHLRLGPLQMQWSPTRQRLQKRSWFFVLQMRSNAKTSGISSHKGISSTQQNTQFLHILQQPSSLCWKKCSQKGVKMQLQASGQLLELQWDVHKIQANIKPFS